MILLTGIVELLTPLLDKDGSFKVLVSFFQYKPEKSKNKFK